jgi:type IV pilus assembly protein PilV
MKMHKHHLQNGASMIEVLVAVLIMSFGMLSLGAMLSLSVQMPKMAGNRAIATNLASSHIEKIRANPDGFNSGAYVTPLTYDGTRDVKLLKNCVYPICTSITLADMDVAATAKAVREELPAGGMLVTCNPTPCNLDSYGNIWIIWQEPLTYDVDGLSASDNCPTQVTSTYTNPKPRCLYVRFKTGFLQ